MISDSQKKGLRELLLNDNNLTVLLQLAKCATKNVCKTEDPEEALRLITTHIPDIYVLLSKRAITKELLFTYLSNRRADAATDFSKADLIAKVIQYWKQEHQSSIELSGDQTSSSLHNQSEEDYPIHKIARKFGEWFFERFNADALSLVDLWADATLHLTIRASDGINELECTTAAEVLSALTSAKQQFDFYFNPNLTHAGIQGRMDSYGQFLVIRFGTLHSRDSCVGILNVPSGYCGTPWLTTTGNPKK
ncbi:GD13553 [Drosophila simulans]|uniref:GD13553 n=1 Tax=Drosophila simulans TaxID=7240 RepID=B4QKU2_DROSI|nr:GD13553 [Drosophila simulans]